MSPVFRHGRLRLYLLKLLDESPRHGYEVIRLLQDRFMGVYAPSPGTIYPRLARLEEEGLVTHDESGGRKVYRITDKGRAELRGRAGDLTELEEEITASVRDIAREVTEDVRATVRSLREELTFAARDMHRGAPAQRDGRAGPGRDQREERQDDPQDRDEARHEARDKARQDRDDARRDRDEARRERHEAGWDRRDARQDEDRDWAGERGWGGWDWQSWTDWPGRRGWPGGAAGWANPHVFRDLEQLARYFSRELKTAAWQAQAVSEDAVSELRIILDEALDRIRAEVFGGMPGAADQEDTADPGGQPSDGEATGGKTS